MHARHCSLLKSRDIGVESEGKTSPVSLRYPGMNGASGINGIGVEKLHRLILFESPTIWRPCFDPDLALRRESCNDDRGLLRIAQNAIDIVVARTNLEIVLDRRTERRNLETQIRFRSAARADD